MTTLQKTLAEPVAPGEHFGAWGSLHHQISTLPDGAEVKIEVVD